MKTMKRVNSISMIIFASIWLAACGTFYGEKGIINDRNNEYQKVQMIPTLTVPSNLPATRLTTDFVVPEITTQQKQPLPLIPPGSLAERAIQHKHSISVEKAEMKQMEAQQAGAAGATPEEMDPNAKDHISPKNVPEVSAIQSGITLVQNSITALTTVSDVSTKLLSPVRNNQARAAKKEEVLIVPLALPASWALIGTAIQHANYRLLVSNQKTNTFYIIDAYPTHGRVTKDSPIIQVHLRAPTNRAILSQSGEGVTEVYLTNIQGDIVSHDVNQRILGDLNDVLQGRPKSNVSNLMRFISRSK